MIEQLLQDEVTVKLKDLTWNRVSIEDTLLIKLYDSIKEDMKKNGLSDKGTFITVESSNKVMDGNHRINILNELYGPNYEVIVKKWKIPMWVISLGITIIEIVRWVSSKAKALYSKAG